MAYAFKDTSDETKQQVIFKLTEGLDYELQKNYNYGESIAQELQQKWLGKSPYTFVDELDLTMQELQESVKELKNQERQ